MRHPWGGDFTKCIRLYAERSSTRSPRVNPTPWTTMPDDTMSGSERFLDNMSDFFCFSPFSRPSNSQIQPYKSTT